MVKPLTRKEIFEEAIARGKAPTIKPLTRQEMIMAKEARRESQETGGGVQACGAKVYYLDTSEMSDAVMYLYTDKECTTKETLEGFSKVMEQQVPVLVNIMVMGSVYGVGTPFALIKDENGTSGKLFAMTGRDEFIELYTAEYVG